MAPELAGSQITALLETVPGIASVLRSPVADAIVNMIRAGAGLEDFQLEDADELVQYAVRRGLIGAAEGDRVLHEARVASAKKRRAPKARLKRPAPPQRRRGKTAKKGR